MGIDTFILVVTVGPLAVIFLSLVVYDRVRYKSWFWERIVIRITGTQKAGRIIDSVERKLKNSGSVFHYSVYTMVVAFERAGPGDTRNVLVTAAAMSGNYSKYAKGMAIRIKYSELIPKKAITVREKIRDDPTRVANAEKRLADMVNQDP